MKTFAFTGELIRKNVTHGETVLTIETEYGEEIMLIVPCDLDDTVKVGQGLKIKIKEK